MTKPSLHFPKRFYWGASTSAHQVEGGTHNNWSVWELENAKTLAHQAEYKQNELPIWPDVKEMATSPENYISGNAADHFHRYKEDFDILESMNANAFRFSIEWSRVEPEEGVWNIEAIEHYKTYIAELKKRHLEPFVTLYHWTEPVWFSKKGGFEKSKNIQYFVRFAEKIMMELGHDLRFITTINEPDTVVIHGYFSQEFPPQSHAWHKGIMVYRNLLSAHKQVYQLGHKMSRRFKIGFTKGYAYMSPEDDSRITKFMVRLSYFGLDDIVLAYVGRKTDFYGVNYYFTDRFKGRNVVHPKKDLSDFGWEMRPENLEHVLMRVHKRHPGVPIFVTESGVADMHDQYRKQWIAYSIQAMNNAIKAGVRLEGYMHWSLLDNFEWAHGFWPRFGLVEVDYKTFKRTVRPSAVWYGTVIKKLRSL